MGNEDIEIATADADVKMKLIFPVVNPETIKSKHIWGFEIK